MASVFAEIARSETLDQEGVLINIEGPNGDLEIDITINQGRELRCELNRLFGDSNIEDDTGEESEFNRLVVELLEARDVVGELLALIGLPELDKAKLLIRALTITDVE